MKKSGAPRRSSAGILLSLFIRGQVALASFIEVNKFAFIETSPFFLRISQLERSRASQSPDFYLQKVISANGGINRVPILKQQNDYIESENGIIDEVTFDARKQNEDNVDGTNDNNPRAIGSSRSTFNPEYEGGANGNRFVVGREERRKRLYAELSNLGIDPTEIESHPDRFGTAAIRTFNSFLLPKSQGAWAVAESPTRAHVVANSISFLTREFKADQEKWLRNIDKNRVTDEGGVSASENTSYATKHKITVILDNVRSAHNVGNILRLAETSKVESVRLCGMTPRPPNPKVLKTAMGCAEYVSLGPDEASKSLSTLHTVIDLKAKGVTVFGVETTANATSLWDAPIPSDKNASVAYVFGNELIGVDVDVLRECDGIISIPTYGMKNSLNIANCVSVVLWDTLRRWQGKGNGD